MATNDPAYPPPQATNDAFQSKPYSGDAPPPYVLPPGSEAPSTAPYPTKGTPYDVSPYPTTGSPGHMQMPHPQQPGVQQPGVVVHQVTHISQAGAVGVTGFAGNCPNCGVGVLTEDFSPVGILLAFFCFPIGILCCLLMKTKRCTTCGATFN